MCHWKHENRWETILLVLSPPQMTVRMLGSPEYSRSPVGPLGAEKHMHGDHMLVTPPLCRIPHGLIADLQGHPMLHCSWKSGTAWTAGS